MTYHDDVLASAVQALATRFGLDKLTQDTERRLLVVDVCVDEEGLRNLLVDQVEVVPLLIVLIVPGVDHTDAFVDALRSCRSDVEPVIPERKENQPEMLLSVEELVESDDR